MRDISDKPFRFVEAAYQPTIRPLAFIFHHPSFSPRCTFQQAQKSIWSRKALEEEEERAPSAQTGPGTLPRKEHWLRWDPTAPGGQSFEGSHGRSCN